MTEIEIIEILQAELVDKIKATTGYSIENYPDNPSDYQLANALGAVLIGGGESNSSEPVNVIQSELIGIDIVILSAELQGEKGMYSVTQQVCKTVQKTPLKGTLAFKTYISKPQWNNDAAWWWRELTFVVPELNYITD